MKGNIWIVGVVAIVLAVAVPAVGLGTESATRTTTASATLTVDVGDSEHLAPSPPAYRFADNETVSVNGTSYVEGTDYAFDAQNGTVEWLDSAQTQADAGESAEVGYTYAYHDETTTSIVGLLGSLGETLGLLLALVCVATVALLSFGGAGGEF
jgi:hypothetical protein